MRGKACGQPRPWDHHTRVAGQTGCLVLALQGAIRITRSNRSAHSLILCRNPTIRCVEPLVASRQRPSPRSAVVLKQASDAELVREVFVEHRDCSPNKLFDSWGKQYDTIYKSVLTLISATSGSIVGGLTRTAAVIASGLSSGLSQLGHGLHGTHHQAKVDAPRIAAKLRTEVDRNRIYRRRSLAERLLERIKYAFERAGASSTNDVSIDDKDGGKLSMPSRRRTWGRALAVVVVYMIIGSFYGQFQGWTRMESIYFVIVTLTTVGYGDLTFGSNFFQEVFGGFFVVFGVVFVGAAAVEVFGALKARAAIVAEQVRRQQAEAVMDANSREEYVYGQESYAGQAAFDIDVETKTVWDKTFRTVRNLVVTILTGSVVMSYLEGWSLSRAFMWACVTTTTVGYGDQVPDCNSAKIFACIFIMLAFGAVASSVGQIASIPAQLRRIRNQDRVLNQFGSSLESNELDTLLKSEVIQTLRSRTSAENQRRTDVNRAEFILWMLIVQEKVDLTLDVGPAAYVFEQLDPDGSGTLDEEDIRIFSQRERESEDPEKS